MTAFRLRPRFGAIAWTCIVLGPAIGALAYASSPSFALACAITGPLIGLAYLALPTWRYRVVVDDEMLHVEHRGAVKMRVAWTDVKKLVHAPTSKTLFVDGGAPAASFLLPGPGAPGPYRVERREELYDLILARVPAERRQEVPSLERAT